MNRKPFFMREVIHSGDASDPYMTRYTAGRLSLHIIHRADNDPACHDHPKGFWTFPLTGYFEDVLKNPELPYVDHNYVGSFRWHRRDAEYRHKIYSIPAFFPIYTIVFWDKENVREWGFWPRVNGKFTFVQWREYLGLDF